ncbi:hypothetical protein F5Y16DRAFT_56455 [Xylariaceae sp. FL0255]|nr:hypothetical protein F5Y16DRAFT_56455 [Xylariaceae sp. FL0255]
MRFTSFIIAGLFAVATSAATTVASSTSTTVSTSSAQSSEAAQIQSCLAGCSPSDTKCRANCIAVPSPDTANVNATTSCVAACPQGNGTAADNQNYANCVSGCIGDYYYTSTGTPNLATSSGASGSGASATATPSVTDIQTTITSGSSTITTSFTSTVSAASSSASPTSSSSKGAAAVYGPIGSGLGLFGLLAGFIAL